MPTCDLCGADLYLSDDPNRPVTIDGSSYCASSGALDPRHSPSDPVT